MKYLNRIKVIIGEEEIAYPNGYFFRFSPVHQKRKVKAEEIVEVNLKTFPASFVTREREILFVKGFLTPHLEMFARRNRIPVRNRFDIWEHINRPFLDTTFDRYEVAQSLRSLKDNGIAPDELKTIRKRVGRTMGLNFVIWESTYLGLYDYLNWTLLTKSKYRWAMDIALRSLEGPDPA